MKIAVYGASGYQGSLVAAAVGRSGHDLRLIGRDPAKVEAAAEQLGLADAERRTSDLDPARLDAALAGCDAVVNCAGPFTLSGDAVARAAIRVGCHYADTSGEQGYLMGLVQELDAEAKTAGVSLVPAATDGGVPTDLIAAIVAEQTGGLARLRVVHRLFGGEGASRGSLRSALATSETLVAGGLVYAGGEWRPGGPLSDPEFQFPDDEGPSKVTRLAAPEVLSIPRHLDVDLLESFTDEAVITLLASVTEEMIEAVPPGPDDESRQAGRFVIVADGFGRDDRRARGIVRGSDTYGTTAEIAVRIAAALASGDAPAGVVAPAQAVSPEAFLDGLADLGVSWSVEVCNAVAHA